VSNGIAVSVSGLTLTGSSATNYTLTQPVMLAANITPAPLAVTATDTNKVYGSVHTFAGTEFTLAGTLFNGDTLTNVSLSSAGAAAGAAVGRYPITPSVAQGVGLGNYTIAYYPGTLTVTPTALTILSIVSSPGNTNIIITWTSISNSVYRVQYKATLSSTNWVSLAPDVIATGTTASLTDHPAGASQRYYRILFVSSAPLTAPVIQSIVGAGTSNVVITWTAISNQVYRVQYNANLASTSWLNLAPDVTATGSTASFTDHPGTASQRFYRVVLLSTVTPLTPLVVVANDASRVYGATNPVFSGTITGVQSGDNITATYATTATPSSPVGTYPITPSLVDPNGKLDNYIVTMTNGSLTISQANSDTVLTSSQNPSLYGSNVTFTVTVTPIGPATTTPTGSVQFYTNGLALGAPVVLSGGMAGLSSATLPVGTNTVGAAYLSDGNYVGSSNSLVQVVRPVAERPSTLTIQCNSGGTLTVTFSGTPGAEYVVQASSDLVSPVAWTNVSTNIAGTNGHWTFTDSTADQPIRFYRAMAP
jgi:hypothetical protein